MNNGWQGQFSSGFAASNGDNTGAVVGIIAIFVILGLLWFGFDQYRRYQLESRKKAPKPTVAVRTAKPNLAKIAPAAGRINALQQKVIYEMIDEFRKQETSAQAIPAAVLEKYSSFFFENVKRLKTSEADVKEFINMNYPIREGYTVEMDFNLPGSMHLIKSRVTAVGAKTLSVAFMGPVPAFIRRGTSIMLNYSVGKHFLQGNSVVAEVRPNEGLVLRKPTQVVLTSERRYSRVTLQRVSGNLHDPKTGYRTTIRVLDLSLEGVRIQVEKPLDKSHIYQLAFEAEAGGHRWGFGPIECAPSKAFMTGAGAYESGLVFLYLDMAARADLNNFMKQLAQELQESKAAPFTM